VKKSVIVLSLTVLLIGCENMYQDDGIPRIRTQRQAEAYNATVSSESEKLVCTRETIIGSNIPQFICMTVAQRERLAQQAREEIQLRSGSIAND